MVVSQSSCQRLRSAGGLLTTDPTFRLDVIACGVCRISSTRNGIELALTRYPYHGGALPLVPDSHWSQPKISDVHAELNYVHRIFTAALIAATQPVSLLPSLARTGFGG